jgi:hypothetical protein
MVGSTHCFSCAAGVVGAPKAVDTGPMYETHLYFMFLLFTKRGREGRQDP